MDDLVAGVDDRLSASAVGNAVGNAVLQAVLAGEGHGLNPVAEPELHEDPFDPTRLRTQMFYAMDNSHLQRLTAEALFHADHATGAVQVAEQRQVAG